jgi:glycosyltransferase involved in cell wall biosynthesis
MAVRRDVSRETALSLSMLGWALNEEESIGEYIERAEKFLTGLTIDFELVLIDDGSTDSTAAIIEEHQRRRPRLRLHRNPENRGSGYNHTMAISLARKDYLLPVASAGLPERQRVSHLVDPVDHARV